MMSRVRCSTTRAAIQGVKTNLGGAYVVDVVPGTTPPDNATRYETVAVFIAGLAPRTHIVQYHSKFTGDALRRPPADA